VVEDVAIALQGEVNNLRRTILEAGRQATIKLRQNAALRRNVTLTPDERTGLELLHAMFGRPAILIQNGMFFTPPPSWQPLLEPIEDVIEQRQIPGVGRIALYDNGIPSRLGTGFVVSSDILMTNQHVAAKFCQPVAGGGWQLRPDLQVTVDFIAESGALDRHEFPVVELVGMHQTVDLALLKLGTVPLPGSRVDPLPAPLQVASLPPADAILDRNIYIVGYPMTENNWADPLLHLLIFANIYWVKRLQPGQIIAGEPSSITFSHDCSTLGGNSGSPVIDLATQQVIGLHFQGAYMKSNEAVSLWNLREDPLLVEAKVNFAPV
jgi:V8-like Glu-specific endopeptidase